MAKRCANCRQEMDENRVFIPGLPRKHMNLDFCSLSCANWWWTEHEYEIKHYEEYEAERARCNVCELRMRCPRYLASIKSKRHYACLKEKEDVEYQC